MHHKETGASGPADILSPFIKKFLTRCVKVGAYPQFQSGYQMTLNSSMSETELYIYIFWRIYYLIKAMKRASSNQYYAMQIKIDKHHIIDNLSEPPHIKLRKVNPSVKECTNRLTKVLNRCSLLSLSTFPLMFKPLENGLLELGPECVRQLCSIVMRHLHVRHTQNHTVRTSCSLCVESIPKSFDL